MTSRRRTGTPSLYLLLALSGPGLVLTAATATAGGDGGRGSYGHGGHGIHRHGGHHHGHHGAVGSHRHHHGLRSHGVRYFAGPWGGHRSFAGPYGGYRNFTVSGGYRSYGGYYYRSFPSYGYYLNRSEVYAYPAYSHQVSYAPVADASFYATPGSVYDPVFQRGVAAQPLDDVALSDARPQPVYVIVQPAAAGSQPPVQTPEPEPLPVATARPDRPLAVSGGEAGEVFLSVHPATAAVYLDDELLGSGDALADGREPLVLGSGVHVLEVVHPQYQTQRLVFGMPSAGRLQIEFDLEGDRRDRKARVKTLE